MANWNSGAIFNAKGGEGGFSWNSKEYILILNLSEVIHIKETLSSVLARLVLTEKGLAVYDAILNAALFDKLTEEIQLDDKLSISLLFKVAEKIGLKDEISDLAVLAYLHDRMDIVEEIQILAQLVAEDKFSLQDDTSIEAFLKTLDDFGLTELEQSVLAYIETHDSFGLTDHEPRQAISDFLIGAIEDDDRAYDWLIPFNMKVDWGNTKIQVMPEAEITSIEMPGIDGSIVADTVYKDRLFSIVAFSEDGMTLQQKEDLKARITQILDSTKHKTKKLTVQARGTTFDVKYEGQADIQSGPSFVKGTIPLQVTPYGYSMFPYELYGSGLVDNANGDTMMRPKHTISGPITNPSFKLGTVTYTWNGTVPAETSLVINHDKYTCYTIDNFGKKKNVLAQLTGDFQAIDAGKSVVLVADENTEGHILTEWVTPVLW